MNTCPVFELFAAVLYRSTWNIYVPHAKQVMDVMGKGIDENISYQEFRKYACFLPSWQVRWNDEFILACIMPLSDLSSKSIHSLWGAVVKGRGRLSDKLICWVALDFSKCYGIAETQFSERPGNAFCGLWFVFTDFLGCLSWPHGGPCNQDIGLKLIFNNIQYCKYCIFLIGLGPIL